MVGRLQNVEDSTELTMKMAIATLVLLVLPSLAMADHRDYYGWDRYGGSVRYDLQYRGSHGYGRYDFRYDDYSYRPSYRDYRYDRYDRCDVPSFRSPYYDRQTYYDSYRGYRRGW